MSKKITKKYYFSTEGETEKWYLKHLEKLINSDAAAFYKVDFCVKKSSPLSYVKSIPVFNLTTINHVFDFESNSQNDVDRFLGLLKEMKKSEKIGKSIKYFPCYSNLTFELWIILHKSDLNVSISDKTQYLKHINKAFNVKYQGLSEFKEEKHFMQILGKITLNDVKNAVARADFIMNQCILNECKIKKFGNYFWYEENPSTEVATVIKKILCQCKLLNNPPRKSN